MQRPTIKEKDCVIRVARKSGGVMMAKAEAFVDGWLAKLTSRKLMVWVTATVLTFSGHVTSDDWVIISAIYIGGQTIIDGIARLKGYND